MILIVYALLHLHLFVLQSCVQVNRLSISSRYINIIIILIDLKYSEY